MHVEVLNAVAREQARIREAVVQAKTITKKIHSSVVGSPQYREEVYVSRAEVLAAINNTQAPAVKLTATCACNECGPLPKVGRFNGQLEDGTPISIGYKVLSDDEAGDLKDVELLEVSIQDKPGEKIPEAEWNLENFKANPVILHSHKDASFVPVLLPGNTVTKLVVMDYADGKVYVYPDPHTADLETWISENTHHRFSSIEWMITEEPFSMQA